MASGYHALCLKVKFQDLTPFSPSDVLSHLKEQGICLKIVMRCESVDAVKNAVKAGIGLGLLYKDTLKSEIERGEVKVIRIPEAKMHADSFIIYHREKPISADARDFLAILRRSQTVLKESPRENFR